MDGTVLQGPDGSVYLIPDEALEAFRIEGTAARVARDLLDGDLEGFAYGAGSNELRALRAVDGRLEREQSLAARRLTQGRERLDP